MRNTRAGINAEPKRIVDLSDLTVFSLTEKFRVLFGCITKQMCRFRGIGPVMRVYCFW
jgi:hypothetical protein